MHVCGNRALIEIPIEIFRAKLDADFRAPFKIDRPLESLRTKSRLLQNLDGPIDVIGGYDKIDSPRDHGFLGPVIHGDTTDSAPGDIRSFEAIHEPHDVVGAAGRLPVEKLLRGHNLILTMAQCMTSRFSQERVEAAIAGEGGRADIRSRADRRELMFWLGAAKGSGMGYSIPSSAWVPFSAAMCARSNPRPPPYRPGPRVRFS